MEDNRKYYVICEDNCKFESMTKEQILTAIEQAASTGTIQDIDTGFVTKIKERNRNTALSFWVGTSAEYNAIAEKQQNCFYILTDETTGADIAEALADMQQTIAAYTAAIPPCMQIIVTTRGGNVTCTDAEGKEIPQASAINNVWTFNVNRYGEYTVSGVYGELTQTKKVEVSAVAQYPVALEYYSSTFGENSWATIIDICKHGVCPDEWAVGDTKSAEEGVLNYPVMIIGKNHDQYESGETAPFTFKFKNTNNDKLPLTSKVMNTALTNAGGWELSAMRTTTLSSFIASNLSETIKNALREVKKFTSAGEGSTAIGETLDKMFLLSEVERFGTATLSAAGEGSQYEFYINGNTDVYSSGAYHWLRSPLIKNYNSMENTKAFCAILAKDTVQEISARNASNTNALAFPAFCF